MLKIIKKTLFFICLYCLSTVYCADGQNILEDKQNQIEISKEQKDKLKCCFKYLLETTSIGYVLFGNKPVYLGCFIEPNTSFHALFSPNNKEFIFTKIIVDLFKELNLPLNDINKDYIFLVQEKSFRFSSKKDKSIYVLFINKKRFVETVNNHLLLFQYVLGPNVTAKRLLEKFLDPNENLFTALNNDVTLMGIVLGYGGQNACCDSFLVRISQFLEPNLENLPLISRKEIYKKVFLDKEQFLPKYADRYALPKIFPSFGYSSLKNEYEDLSKRLITSATLSDQTYPDFPYFGCIESNETQTIIKDFSKTQKDLLNILSSNDLLEKFLLKLGIDNFHFNQKNQIGVQKNADYSNLVSQMFLYSFKNGFNNNPVFIRAFIEGLKTKDKEHPVEWELEVKRRHLEQKVQAKKNLNYAESFFKNLKNTNVKIPGKLNYITLQKGINDSLNSYSYNVSVHYKLSRLDNKPFDVENNIGTKIKEPISNFIPGIALSLIDMKKNEKRKIYMHPSFAYGENTTLEPNLGLVVEIELMDFAKNQNIKTNIEPFKLQSNDDNLQKLEDELNKNIESLGKEIGFQNALILKKYKNFSLEKIIHNLENQNQNEIDPENDKIQNEIYDLYWLIYKN